jgi:hypothetical protein
VTHPFYGATGGESPERVVAGTPASILPLPAIAVSGEADEQRRPATVACSLRAAGRQVVGTVAGVAVGDS